MCLQKTELFLFYLLLFLAHYIARPLSIINLVSFFNVESLEISAALKTFLNEGIHLDPLIFADSLAVI